MYNAKILCDSISPDGVRLTSVEVTFPRIVLAEYNTHRVFSRNSASSRAIPIKTQIKKLIDDPFTPFYWGKNQKGMQALEELSISEQDLACKEWLEARDDMVRHAQNLLDIGVHKQITNRLLEPFMWQTVICTATEWDNFFGLRRHPDAQPEIRRAADLIWQAMQSSEPKLINYGDWHLPLIGPWDSFDLEVAGLDVRMVSAGRCARVSYLTHDGKRDPQADIDLAKKLQESGHMSPYEHVARPMSKKEIEIYSSEAHHMMSNQPPFCGNFKGWFQFRKELPFENDYTKILENEGDITITTEYLNDR